MLSLDLFNTVYERALNEGAVDDLEARRIHGLNTKMLELMSRAKGAKPEMKAALMREYAKIKDERDSYFKVRTNEMGYGGLTHEGKDGIGQDLVTPQQRVQQSQPQKQSPIGKVADTAKQAAKWLAGKGGPGKEGPTYESELAEEEEAQKELGLGYGVYQELLQAWNEKKPYVEIPMPGGTLTITRNQVFNVLYALKNMNDNSFKKTIQTAFTTLPKFMVWSNSIKRYQLPQEKPEPAPGGIAPGGKEMVQQPLIKEAGQKKKSKSVAQPQSAEVQRYLTKVRRAAPNATSDIEALAKNEIQTQRQIDRKLAKLDRENDQLSNELAQVAAANQAQDTTISRLSQQTTAPAVTRPAAQPVKTAQPVATAPVSGKPTTTTTKAQPATAEVPSVVYIPEPAQLSQKDQEIYSRVKDLETELKDKIDAMASWNKVAANDEESRNELEMLRKDMERTKRELNHKIKQLKKSGAVPAEPRQAGLDLAPTRSRSTPAAALRRSLDQTIGKVPARELPAPSEPELNILSQADFDRLSADLARRPVEVEEGRMGELDAMRQDLELMTDQQFKAAYKMRKQDFIQKYRTLLKPAPKQDAPVIDEHGGGIGPKQRWQDLMHERKLVVGDPVVVTGPNEFEGKTGEIDEFSPSGKFVVVNLYNHGRHSMHLSDVAYNEYADEEDEVDEGMIDAISGLASDLYHGEQGAGIMMTAVGKALGMQEGWSNKMVARRTGQAPTPYSVFIKGKEWKSFPDDDHAENVANKLRAKFEAEGRDPSVITIAPTDYDKGIKEDIGSWIVFDPETKQIKKRFKTHTAGKSYAKTHGLGFASSEYYFDNIKPQAVAEARPISKPEDGIIALKKFSAYLKKNIVDLASMADFELDHSNQPYVDERFEGFLTKADGTPITPIFNVGGKLALVGPNKEYLNIPTEMYYRFRGFMYGGQLENDLMKILSYKQKGVAEAETDYSKRRQRERDIDAGKPVPKQRQSKQTDYQKRRAQDKKDIELGEDQDTPGVERAILNRIMVAHTDLLMKFGPEKVMQAVEEVAYNVGDVDEVGSSDVSAWVHEVKQILGAE